MKTRLLLVVSSFVLTSVLIPSAVSAAPEVGGKFTVGSDQQVVREDLAARLVRLGLSPEEATTRVSQLTADDLAVLADHPEQLAVGGVKDTTLIIIAGIIILPSLLIILLV